MSGPRVFHNLERFFSRYQDDPSSAALASEFRAEVLPALTRKSPESSRAARDLYERALFLLEKDAADNGFEETALDLQRGMYRELEGVLSSAEFTRHHFVVVVPVADRPLMLRNFLDSLAEQLHAFGYGGAAAGSGPVTVFVIDDSNDPSKAMQIRKIAEEASAGRLPAHYVGRAGQEGILKAVPAGLRKKLSGLIGDFGDSVPGHKGASVTRNIAYLYLLSRLGEFPEKTLLWFIDSDEEFKVKVKRGEEIKDVSFINYFSVLDRIFGSSDVEVLTGKVVGDPPVTPAVMINTFLEDTIAFLAGVAAAKPDDGCIFHGDRSPVPFSAEYHDMTGLFGYRRQASPKEYHCSLTSRHTVRDCFDDFSRRASGFFSGLHPTRTQYYVHDRDPLKTTQARTVYTGNYVIRKSGLAYFLPFAGLGLRMAGPTLGRILRKRIGPKFVSANLPLLHKRTLPGKFKHEFRSGIRKGTDSLDLSAEFVRQFWGDVMLFSVEGLTDADYPDDCDETAIPGAVEKTQERIWRLYREHQTEVGGKISRIKRLLEDPGRWWNLRTGTEESVRNLFGFCGVAERNFGPDSAALGKISGQIEEGSMTRDIVRAIGSFQEDDRLWREALKALSGGRR